MTLKEPDSHILGEHWSRRRTALVLLLYALLTVLLTWPIAGRLGTYIPASDGDAWVHLWTFDWIKQALTQGLDPYFTDLLFYPDGVSLAFHNIAWVHIAAWLPLQALVGPDIAYSLIFLVGFTLNGFATYLLAREISGSELAAFVGGLIVAFWPYTLSHHNHPNLILIAWIPLALLYLKRLFDRQRFRDALFAALFIALIGLTRWQLLVMGGFLIGAYVIYRLVVDKRARTPRILGLLATVGVLALLIMSPLLAPVVSAQLTRLDPESLFVDEELGQTDLLAYLVPNRYHPLWGEGAFQLTENFTVNKVFVPFLGFTTLLLALYGTITTWPQSRFWLLAAILYVILALGPDLQVNGRVFHIPMPYELVEDTFFIQIIRRPDRLNVLLSIPIAILSTLGIATLLQSKAMTRMVSLPGRVGSRWAPIGLVTLLALLILAEYIVEYPTFPLTIPEWYEELAEEPGEFGVLGIPISPRATPDKAFMFYQRVHGKPIVEGHVSRPPGDAFDFIEQVPLLQGLRSVEISTPDPALINVSEQLRQLAKANIRYLILHKAFLSVKEVDSWKSWLVQEPLHEDDDLVVYRTDPRMGRDFVLADRLSYAADGRVEVGLIRASVSPTEITPASTVQVSTIWASEAEIDRDYDVCFQLTNFNGELSQSHCEQLAPEWPSSQWSTNEIVNTRYAFEADTYLNKGVYKLSASLIDGETGRPAGDSVPLGSLNLVAVPRIFDEPDPSMVTNINWDDKIYLPGYDLSHPDQDSLSVTLYWQALDRMNTSYTAFLHLIDPATGEIVSQADVTPRGWSYPTNWWERDELVEDSIVLSLASIPAGEYELYAGWYDLETGERLPAYLETGEAIPGSAALLTIIQR